MNKLLIACVLTVIGGANRSAAFLPSKNHGRPSSLSTTNYERLFRKPSTSLALSADFLEPSFIGGSFMWGLNFYYGFDWLLAPLGTGLDSDFNPAYRTATFAGSLMGGKAFGEALEASNGSLEDEDGDRPEMGSRIGSGANVGYITQVDDEDADWLTDREAGLRSSAPFGLQIAVVLVYAIFGALAMAVTESLQTAAVLAIPALVYEIGRPSLPTREEAKLDYKLSQAIDAFCKDNVLVYGQEPLTEGVTPVRRDEATNERELVGAFKRDLQSKQQQQQQVALLKELSDFQIEMRFRELGTGRSEGGYIKGLRLLR